MAKKGTKTAIFTVLFCSLCLSAYSQSDTLSASSAAVSSAAAQTEVSPREPANSGETVSNGRITLEFKDADLRNVLKVLAYKSGVNIVASPEVSGNVTIKLTDVPWKEALKTILSAYGYGYDQRENIIMVAPLEKLTEQKKQEVELAQVQPTVTEVFTLKFIDAGDAKKAIEPQLSSRGEVTALETTGKIGWEWISEGKTKKKDDDGDGGGGGKGNNRGGVSRTKTLIITDTPLVFDKIKKVIADIDIRPQQVVIESRIVEANKDRLRDIGLDWGTGSSGAESSTLSFTPAGKNKSGTDTSQIGGHLLSDQITSSVFGPKASGLTAANTGLKVAFKRLTGSQFEVILHALEEDVNTNILSSPRIMALNNQEAAILVGTKYPILKQDTTGAGSTAVVTSTLDYYQEIGVQLNVIPQIGADNFINMIIHPAITSYTETIGDNAYPIIQTREAETSVLMKDGETIIIGGLLKDIKSKGQIGIPFLGKIPFIGALFQRQTEDIEKIDLLIFITAHIVKEGEFDGAHIAALEERLNTLAQPKKKKMPRVNKR